MQNKFAEVQDFNWLYLMENDAKSPNWSLVPSDVRCVCTFPPSSLFLTSYSLQDVEQVDGDSYKTKTDLIYL